MKFFFTNPAVPKRRYLYAVHEGDHAGKFISYIQTDKDFYEFLSVPGNEKLKIHRKVFEDGYKCKIVVFVEKLPRSIYKTLVKQFKFDID